MKRVMVVSDNHGDAAVLEKIVDRHRSDVDAMIHCGDSEMPCSSAVMAPFLKVKGNCDFDKAYPNEFTQDIADLRFFVTHGHLFDVKMSPMPLGYRGEEQGAQIVCFGHSHIAESFDHHGMIFINPGSIRLPRMRRENTYAIVEFEDKHHICVKFYEDSDGAAVEDLEKSFDL